MANKATRARERERAFGLSELVSWHTIYSETQHAGAIARKGPLSEQASNPCKIPQAFWDCVPYGAAQTDSENYNNVVKDQDPRL